MIIVTSDVKEHIERYKGGNCSTLNFKSFPTKLNYPICVSFQV